MTYICVTIAFTIISSTVTATNVAISPDITTYRSNKMTFDVAVASSPVTLLVILQLLV